MLKSIGKLAGLGLMFFSGYAHSEELRSFQPFELSVGTNSISPGRSLVNSSDAFYSNALSLNYTDNQATFDFLGAHKKGYHLATNKEGLFGNELVVGMKFADWLTLRLNVIDEHNNTGLFASASTVQPNYSNSDSLGYQFGVSSVMNINHNWRLGFDLGKGRIGGDLMGLYQDQLETTRLGFGIRNQKFGAKFQSDFMNRSSNNELEQSTMDLQVDWHFTRDGTVSFGARRSINENNVNNTSSIDQFSGTVPYIKFKHNL